jgi:hypothetical protein
VELGQKRDKNLCHKLSQQTASLQLELSPGTARFTQDSVSQNDVRPRTFNAERPEYIFSIRGRSFRDEIQKQTPSGMNTMPHCEKTYSKNPTKILNFLIIIFVWLPRSTLLEPLTECLSNGLCLLRNQEVEVQISDRRLRNLTDIFLNCPQSLHASA